MNIIEQDQKRLDNIAKAYCKWYELIKNIGRKLDESQRLTTNTR